MFALRDGTLTSKICVRIMGRVEVGLTTTVSSKRWGVVGIMDRVEVGLTTVSSKRCDVVGIMDRVEVGLMTTVSSES